MFAAKLLVATLLAAQAAAATTRCSGRSERRSAAFARHFLSEAEGAADLRLSLWPWPTEVALRRVSDGAEHEPLPGERIANAVVRRDLELSGPPALSQCRLSLMKIYFRE